MQTCLIFNPGAGSAEDVRDVTRHYAEQHGCTFCATSQRGQAGEVAQQAVRSGCPRLIAAGGDGTINEILNGMLRDGPTRTELAVVPLGTGNDLARTLGIPADDHDAALHAALHHRTRPVDVVRLHADSRTIHFLNVSSGGVGGEVAQRLDAETKARWGPLAYWATVAGTLADLPEYDIELTLDDGTMRLHVHGLAIANGRYVGGGLAIAPRAMLDDGLFDAVVFPAAGFGHALAEGLELVTGRFAEGTRLMTTRARRAVVRSEPKMHFNVDGEPVGEVDAMFDILPTAVPLVVGYATEAITAAAPTPPLHAQHETADERG